MAETNCCGTIFSLIYFAISIAILALTILIYKYTIKDPFEERLNEGETWKDFFISAFEDDSSDLEIQNKEQILANISEIPFENNTQFQRYLKMEEYKCQNYKEDILELEQTSTLNIIFKSHFKTIHKMALGLLIMVIIGIGVFVITLIALCGSICCGECAYVILIPFLPIIFLYSIGSGIVNLILFIILSVNYFNSDISTYVSFLDCKDVSKNRFHRKYEDIENLKNIFIPFFVLYIIYIVFGLIHSAINRKKKKDQK